MVGAGLKLPAVPVVIVFTKFDEFEGETRVIVENNYPNEDQARIDILVGQKIERQLQDRYLKPLRCITNDKFPHAVVSGKDPLRLSTLILSSNLQCMYRTGDRSRVLSKPLSNSWPEISGH